VSVKIQLRGFLFFLFLLSTSAQAIVSWKVMGQFDANCGQTCAIAGMEGVETGTRYLGQHDYFVCATFVGTSGQPGHYRPGYSTGSFRCSTEYAGRGNGGRNPICLCDPKNTAGDFKWIVPRVNQVRCDQVCAAEGGIFKFAVTAGSPGGNSMMVCNGSFNGTLKRPGYSAPFPGLCTFEDGNAGVRSGNWECLCTKSVVNLPF